MIPSVQAVPKLQYGTQPNSPAVEDFCAIQLTRGYVALVDPEDFQRFGHLKWYAAEVKPGFIYAVRNIKTQNGQRPLRLHAEVLDVPRGTLVDHRDGDTMNCRRFNLRVATTLQNAANKRISIRNSSGFKGVHLHKVLNKWLAGVRCNGVYHYCGLFDIERPEDAAAAYDRKALELFGEFARTNF